MSYKAERERVIEIDVAHWVFFASVAWVDVNCEWIDICISIKQWNNICSPSPMRWRANQMDKCFDARGTRETNANLMSLRHSTFTDFIVLYTYLIYWNPMARWRGTDTIFTVQRTRTNSSIHILNDRLIY